MRAIVAIGIAIGGGKAKSQWLDVAYFSVHIYLFVTQKVYHNS